MGFDATARLTTTQADRHRHHSRVEGTPWDALDDIVPIVEAFLLRPPHDDQPQP
jgi:hypothetical protein